MCSTEHCLRRTVNGLALPGQSCQHQRSTQAMGLTAELAISVRNCKELGLVAHESIEERLRLDQVPLTFGTPGAPH
jgi:hypothetical protein